MTAESGAQLGMCGPDAKAEASPGRSGAPSSAGDLQPRLMLLTSAAVRSLDTLYSGDTAVSEAVESPSQGPVRLLNDFAPPSLSFSSV